MCRCSFDHRDNGRSTITAQLADDATAYLQPFAPAMPRTRPVLPCACVPTCFTGPGKRRTLGPPGEDRGFSRSLSLLRRRAVKSSRAKSRPCLLTVLCRRSSAAARASREAKHEATLANRGSVGGCAGGNRHEFCNCEEAS